MDEKKARRLADAHMAAMLKIRRCSARLQLHKRKGSAAKFEKLNENT